jgi:hypothetical protein
MAFELARMTRMTIGEQSRGEAAGTLPCAVGTSGTSGSVIHGLVPQ